MTGTFAGFGSFRLNGVQVSEEEFGRGSYAVVLRLEYRGLKCAGKKLYPVLYEQGVGETVRRFEGECRLLAQMRHPNIVQFIGVYFEEGSRVPILVMEFLPTTLARCIDTYGLLPKEISYSILHDAALGLYYLHSQTPPTIHRDLSANNVLLTPNMTAKISDLGVARILNLTPQQMSRMTQTPGTPAYMPPEAMRPNPVYDTRIDEFSYGILMIHVLCGRWPLPLCEAAVVNPANRAQLLPVSEAERRDEYLQQIGNAHPLMGLILRCVSNDPQQRARAAEIVQQMEDLIHQFPPTFANQVEMLQRIKNDETLKQDLREENERLITQVEESREESERVPQQHQAEVEQLHAKINATQAQLQTEIQERQRLLTERRWSRQEAGMAAQIARMRHEDILSKKSQGDSKENVVNQLNCILDTGFYIYDTTSSSGSEIVLQYVHNTSCHSQSSTPEMNGTMAQESMLSRESFTYPRSSESHSGSVASKGPMSITSVQCWSSEQISDFVSKLGFLDAEKEGGDRIRHFLHIKEIAYKLLSLYKRLKELGHPLYYLQAGGSLQNTLICGIDRAMAKRKVIYTEQVLASWAKRVAELHSIYDWLLFFSVPKLLLLHRLLKEGSKAGPLAEARPLAEVVREVSFLYENTANTREQLMKGVKESLASCHAAIHAGEAPMHVVGQFLASLFGNHSLPQQRGTKFGLPSPCSVSRMSPSSESAQMLHYCPNYTQAELIQLIVSIYNGVPESLEVFRCRPSSTAEELSLFLKRVAKLPLQYLMLDVNHLPFKLQEYLMQLYLLMQQQAQGGEKSGVTPRAPCIHFIETAPSVLRGVPWITLSEHQESGPSLSFEDTRKVCLESVVRPDDFSRIELVYGRPGDGKTYYIQQQLQSCPAGLTITVNEAFSPLNTIRKLQGLPVDKHHCGIFFNFTLLPPGDSVADSERERHQKLVEAIGWFFFDLLLLGYVEDPETGLSFRIPSSLEWTLYIEVPSYDHIRPGNAYKQFCHDLPTLGLLGSRQYIPPDTPYSVDAEVQLVCKYLQAFRKGGGKGIDKLYRESLNQPVKFSLEQDLPDKACQDLLLEFMPEHMSKTKSTQRLFFKYMHRRCSFLDSLPGFNFNCGFGEYVSTERGRIATDTRQLGSTLMSAMLKEVADFCDPAIKANWSHEPHHRLIYDFKEGGASMMLISLHPDQLTHEDKLRFQRIGVKIPSTTDLHSRSLLDGFLSHALSVELENGRLAPIDDSAYVLTLDHAIKIIDIHERYYCGVPVIIEGEAGVGKTALVEMLSKLWNHTLLVQWKRECSRLLEFMGRKLGASPVDSTKNYQKYLDVLGKLSCGRQLTEEELVSVGQLPDTTTTSGRFYSILRNRLLSMRDNPVISLLMIEGTGPSLEEHFRVVNSKDTAQDTAHLLHGILTSKIAPTFHKVTINAVMTPGDIREQFKPAFSQACSLKEAYQRRNVSQRVASGSSRVPSVTVFLDEMNTSSSLGLFKEIIVDRSFDGEPIPENMFIVAACNPHHGNPPPICGSTSVIYQPL